MTLSTKRLILRPWQESDVDDLVEGLNNIDVSQWLAFVPHPYTKKDAEVWIQHCIEQSKDKNSTAFEFAIELKSEKKVIGSVSMNRINRSQGIAGGGGIWVNPTYQGYGYGSEAFGEKIRFAFEDLHLRRLENGYFKDNIASQKMQEKFGYKGEGIKRKAFLCVADGVCKDEYITGLLREDWEKLV